MRDIIYLLFIMIIMSIEIVAFGGEPKPKAFSWDFVVDANDANYCGSAEYNTLKQNSETLVWSRFGVKLQIMSCEGKKVKIKLSSNAAQRAYEVSASFRDNSCEKFLQLLLKANSGKIRISAKNKPQSPAASAGCVEDQLSLSIANLNIDLDRPSEASKVNAASYRQVTNVFSDGKYTDIGANTRSP